MIKICHYCKKQFDTPKSIRKFCSKDCANKSFKGRKLTMQHREKISKNNARYWLGKKLPFAMRQKLIQSVDRQRKMGFPAIPRGNKSWAWKGGNTSQDKIIRASYRYKEWRKKVFTRDNWTCQKCGKKGGTLNPHHIKPFAEYPKLRFVVNNGITLCKKCHKKAHKHKF
jgi:hypothetical protein